MESMDATRKQLRRYLLPETVEAADPESDLDGDFFPRSKVMRFAFNPRNRKLLMISGSVLAVLATRVIGPGKMGLVAELARSITRNKG